VIRLATKGGKNVRKAVENMLGGLLSNDVMRSMNWTGMCGKTGFKTLKCCDIIKRE